MSLFIVRNDITKMKVDAIVNAANNSLLGGGGVDGAIHRAAGPKLLEECKTLGGCKTGEAKITQGYNLQAKFIIHTVGPIWQGGQFGEEKLLAFCYQESLKLAIKNNCSSIAFPLISTGAYGYPKKDALRVAINTIKGFLEKEDISVYLVIFEKETLIVSQKLFYDVCEYIYNNYVDFSEESRMSCMRIPHSYEEDCYINEAPSPSEIHCYKRLPSLAEELKNLDESFSQMLFRLIDEKGMTDVECYKKANVDRKVFSRIRNLNLYRPSKTTAVAFAIALELPLDEAKRLIELAGYSLTHNNKFDVIIEYFIVNKIYDILEINEVLFEFDQKLLGC